MSPQQLVDELRDRGVELTLKGDGKIHFRYRSEAVTPELREALVRLKPEVQSLLAIEALLRVFPGAQVVSGDGCDPMPELPEDVRYAIGFGYGDGQPGSWDVVRRRR